MRSAWTRTSVGTYALCVAGLGLGGKWGMRKREWGLDHPSEMHVAH